MNIIPKPFDRKQTATERHAFKSYHSVLLHECHYSFQILELPMRGFQNGS